MADYCFELSALEMDFRFIGERLLGQYYDMAEDFEEWGSPEELLLKKFLVTHAQEDACYRLYAYQEKAFQLVNAALAVGCSEEDRELRDKIRGWLRENRERQILERFTAFSRDTTVREMIDLRHGYAHRLSWRDVKGLSGPRRLLEWLDWEPGMDQLLDLDRIDMVSASMDVDAYRQELVGKLQRIEGAIEAFEAGLCRDLEEALEKRGWRKTDDEASGALT